MVDEGEEEVVGDEEFMLILLEEDLELGLDRLGSVVLTVEVHSAGTVSPLEILNRFLLQVLQIVLPWDLISLQYAMFTWLLKSSSILELTSDVDVFFFTARQTEQTTILQDWIEGFVSLCLRIL